MERNFQNASFLGLLIIMLVIKSLEKGHLNTPECRFDKPKFINVIDIIDLFCRGILVKVKMLSAFSLTSMLQNGRTGEVEAVKRATLVKVEEIMRRKKVTSIFRGARDLTSEIAVNEETVARD